MWSPINKLARLVVFFAGFPLSDGWVVRVLNLFYVFALVLTSVSARAEGTMVATVLQADFARDPEVRLLVRVADVGGGEVSAPMASRSNKMKWGQTTFQ